MSRRLKSKKLNCVRPGKYPHPHPHRRDWKFLKGVGVEELRGSQEVTYRGTCIQGCCLKKFLCAHKAKS